MSMKPQDVKLIRDTFNFSKRDLAKALNVAVFTVTRWESGGTIPSGLQEEVLRALHQTAIYVLRKKDDAMTEMISGKISLGIGALIFYLITESEEES